MTRDTKSRLLDLARHERDEEAGRMRRFEQRLAELEETEVALRGEIGRAEMALREKLADPFERAANENYVVLLRERLVGIRAKQGETRVERDEAREKLEKRMIRHKQMDHLVTSEMKVRQTEVERREELESDDLASGHWYQVREGNGD